MKVLREGSWHCGQPWVSSEGWAFDLAIILLHLITGEQSRWKEDSYGGGQTEGFRPVNRGEWTAGYSYMVLVLVGMPRSSVASPWPLITPSSSAGVTMWLRALGRSGLGGEAAWEPAEPVPALPLSLRCKRFNYPNFVIRPRFCRVCFDVCAVPGL